MAQILISISCDDHEADSVRLFARKYFRQLRLRCKTSRTYPMTGWNTPSAGEAIWVYAEVSPLQGQVLHSKDLRQIAHHLDRKSVV